MISPINPLAGKTRMPRRYYPRPYWTFWKVVLAGWMVRYPKTFFALLGICIALIYNAVTK